MTQGGAPKLGENGQYSVWDSEVLAGQDRQLSSEATLMLDCYRLGHPAVEPLALRNVQSGLLEFRMIFDH